MSAHVHLDPADLLQWRLDPRGVERELAASAEACPECAARADALFDLAIRGREAALWIESAAASEDRSRADTLAARVLSLSTRANPGVRGDLRLVLDHCRARLRSSLLLRVAAASLALHLAALPVLAWLVLHEEEETPTFRGRIEPPREPAPAEPIEAPRAPVIDEPEPETRLVEGALRSEEAARALRHSDRARLLRKEAPDVTALERPDEPIAALLWARSQRIHRGRLDLEALGRARPSDPLALALAAEVLLDHWALAGARAPELDRALADLAAASTAGGGAQPLVAAALERARRYGVGEAPDVRADEVEILGPDWVRALSDACTARSELAPDPVVRAWLALPAASGAK